MYIYTAYRHDAHTQRNTGSHVRACRHEPPLVTAVLQTKAQGQHGLQAVFSGLLVDGGPTQPLAS